MTERKPVQMREMGRGKEESEREAGTDPEPTERIRVSLLLLCLPSFVSKENQCK